MSHITTVQTLIKDLDALDDACKDLGATLHRGYDTFNWYRDPRKCDHMISVPGIHYQVGLVRKPGTDGYEPLYDDFGNGDNPRHDGKKLISHLGKGLVNLLNHYGSQVAMRQIRALHKIPVRTGVGTAKLTVSCQV